MADVQQFESLIARARRRLRLQYLLDGGTLGIAAGLFIATVVMACGKAGLVAPSSMTSAYLFSALGPLGGILWALLRKIDDVSVAALIDRSNDFDDRLASAYQFSQSKERSEFQEVQIADTLSRLDQVDPSKAHRFKRPRDLTAVAIFGLALLVMWAVQFPGEREERPVSNAGADQTVEELTRVQLNGAASKSASGDPLTYRWEQVAGPPVILDGADEMAPIFESPEVLRSTSLTFALTVNDGRFDSGADQVSILVEPGEERLVNLDSGIAAIRQDQVEELIKEAEEAGDEEAREAAEELRELLEEDQRGEVTPEEFKKRLDSVADKLQEGCETVTVDKLMTKLKPLSSGFSDEDFVATLTDQIERRVLEDAAATIDEKAEGIAGEGKFANGLDKAAFYRGVDETIEQNLLCTAGELEKMEDQLEKAAAAELAKDELTKELGEAIKDGNMEKAADEIEKIAEKIANDELSEKEIERLAKLLEMFADKLDLNDPDLAKKFEKYKKLAEKLQKKMDKKGKLSAKEKKQLDDAKKNLERLQREKEKNERGEAGRQLKRLEQQMRKAASEMRRDKKEQASKLDKDKGKGDESKDGENNPDGEKRHSDDAEASEKGDRENGSGEEETPEMRAADELRRMQKERQGENAKDDLKETTERMKEDAKRSEGRKGKKQDLGNDERANKIDDYLKQAKGQKKDGEGGEGGEKKGEGQGGEKKGEGQGNGQKKAGDGGNDDGNNDGPSDGAGKGHTDPDGARTADLDGQREDTEVSGEKGGGPSTAETIKKAAQSGFANRKYKEVYEEYEKAVEDVLEQEKVPPGYRHYVRTYFDFIRPQDSRAE